MKEFKLDKEPKIGTGFKIPENYFENLESQILRTAKEKEILVSGLQRQTKWMIAVAAVFIILLSIPIVNLMATDSNQIDEAQLEQYLAQESAISEDDIAELLDDDKLQKMKIELDLSPEEIEEILLTTNNLEEYIIN